ncbi:MAG: 16S rRNA (guanine(527)-N(7))-methyltransferase RsmG [Bacteroidales bacterium]|jgi:16S rRNA (guanine527-N7)-methyltransferase|nr:16S rRNA (guanine(527)-N(7))-methyltransferase RsmG [Bacteroidales bacterium]
MKSDDIVSILDEHFPFLTPQQKEKYCALADLYKEWNEKINLISRKDIDNVFVHHILHSLATAKIVKFKPNCDILDVGTGGGLPGIPLAIMFPKTNFMLVDSVGKKIRVVEEITAALELKNVKAANVRAETLNQKFDFIVSRAVTTLPEFYKWMANKVSKIQYHNIKNGILYLKGGDLKEELQGFVSKKVKIYDISAFFNDEYFETKKVIHISI